MTHPCCLPASLCHFSSESHGSFQCSRIECDFLVINHSNKWVKNCSLRKRPGCSNQQWVALATDAQGKATSHQGPQEPWGWGWGVAGNPAVSSWFSSLQAGVLRKANSFPICLRGEMPNYHASDFSLEGWRQGLNSAPPRSLQRLMLLESLAVTLPPPHTHTLPYPQHPSPPPTKTHTHTLEDTDRQRLSCQHQPWPVQHPDPETGMERQEDTALRRIGALTKPVLNIPFTCIFHHHIDSFSLVSRPDFHISSPCF